MKTLTKNTVSLGYGNIPDSNVSELAGTVATAMDGNPAYPNPPIPLRPVTVVTAGAPGGAVAADPPLDLTTLRTLFDNDIQAAAGGGVALTAAKDAAREDLLIAMDQLAFYVQSVARFDLPMLLTSGFSATSNNHAQSELATPVIMGIANNQPTQLAIQLPPVDNAHGYEVQISTGSGTWQTAVTSTQARKIVLTGLTSGALYNVRVRAIGGSTGYSGWSMTGSSYVT